MKLSKEFTEFHWITNVEFAPAFDWICCTSIFSSTRISENQFKDIWFEDIKHVLAISLLPGSSLFGSSILILLGSFEDISTMSLLLQSSFGSLMSLWLRSSFYLLRSLFGSSMSLWLVSSFSLGYLFNYQKFLWSSLGSLMSLWIGSSFTLGYLFNYQKQFKDNQNWFEDNHNWFEDIKDQNWFEDWFGDNQNWFKEDNQNWFKEDTD